ncbi:hypothetical protein RAN53_09100 [Halomonas sp. SSL-5]|uniref:hypothetical protein n=1 Tax=Halomonas sp. SSL-5 TaxID=3065855 RepID=UPI00273938E7|nr:hypothetical protein [Halomonas sp. SSL-5]MDY7116505.1 hypothetical protein [Halomonas sp. SSL-5]
MALPTGTLLIDARSAGARLPRELALVASLAADQAFELVVIDDTRDPRVAGIARRHGTRHLRLPAAPLGERLANVIPNTNGPVLVFPVIGCLDATYTLLQLARRVGADEVDAVILPGSTPGLFARLLGRRQSDTAAGICLARHWYDRIGGCDPRLDRDAISDLVERLRHCGARLELATPAARRRLRPGAPGS